MATRRIFASTAGWLWSNFADEPTISDDVILKTGKLTVDTSTRYTDDFTTEAGTTLIVSSGATLSVWLLFSLGAVTINGTLIQRGLVPGFDSENALDIPNMLDSSNIIDLPNMIDLK